MVRFVFIHPPKKKLKPLLSLGISHPHNWLLIVTSAKMSAATATDSCLLLPFYGNERDHINRLPSLAPLSTKQSIYANGVPHLISNPISDRAWIHARNAHKNDGDLILVHQTTIDFKETKYTVDYITTQNMGVWYQYTVFYHSEFMDTPLPHNVDFRFETNQALSVPPAHNSSSSSAFRAAAYASMKAGSQI
jgi:hypothetical protein